MKNKVRVFFTQNFILAVLINFLTFLFVVFVCNQKYEVSDDFVMETVLSGAYSGVVDPHVLYMNVIWGYLLALFYDLVGGVSWYFVGLMTVAFFSFLGMTYYFFDKFEKKAAIAISIVFLVFLLDDIYILVQFTKIATFSVGVGGILYLYGVFNNAKKKIFVFWGGALIICGSLIRFLSIYTAGAFLLILIITEFIKIIRRKNKCLEDAHRWGRVIGLGAGIIIIVLGCYVFEQWYYMNNTEYKEWRTFNEARSGFVDFPTGEYDENISNYEAIDFSENDFVMAKTWQFGDSDYFTTEKFLEIKDASGIEQTEERKGFIQEVKELFLGVRMRQYWDYGVCWAVLLFGGIAIIFSKEKRWKVWGAIMLMGASIIIYFFLIGRVVYRMEHGVFVMMILSIVYTIDNLRIKKKYANKALFVAVLGVLIGRTCLFVPEQSYKTMSEDEYWNYVNTTFYKSEDYNINKYRYVVEERALQREFTEEVEGNKENFYFMDFEAVIQRLYLDVNVWQSLEKGYYSNHVIFASVISNHPQLEEVLENAEVNNPMESLMKDNVYLVDRNNEQFKVEFLYEHYGEVEIELYKELDGYQIWKIK